MPDLALIVQAIDFVEDNLKQSITVGDMASAVSYSLYHYCRVFNQATHHTPYDYLMRRRLSEAARSLLETDQKIIDVALEYQFNNPETFSRAFKRMFGRQPSQLRKECEISSRQLMPRLTLAHLINLGQGLEPELVEFPASRLAGVMALVGADRKGILDLWRLLDEELARSDISLEPRIYHGVALRLEGSKRPNSFYLAAVEIQDQDIKDTSLVVKPIPALNCARFLHKGPEDDLALTMDYVYHTWLPKAGESLSRHWIIERYCASPNQAGQPTEIELLFPLK